MAAITRSKTRLHRDCVRREFDFDDVTEEMINTAIRERRKYLANKGFVESNAFAARWFLDVIVPAGRALASGLTANIIVSMNSVIRAMRTVVYDRCLMAGGYPTFLLGKTTKFSDIDFVLVVDAQDDYYSFFVNFVELVREQLDPNKNWRFEVCCNLPYPWNINIKNFLLSDSKSVMSFVTKGTNTKEKEDFPGTNRGLQVVKLEADGVKVAEFCFFIQDMHPKKLTISKEKVVDSLLRPEDGYIYDSIISKINKLYDTYVMMNVASFITPDRGLHCYNVSGMEDIRMVDVRCLPVFNKDSEAPKCRIKELGECVSKSFKHHVQELRRLALEHNL